MHARKRRTGGSNRSPLPVSFRRSAIRLSDRVESCFLTGLCAMRLHHFSVLSRRVKKPHIRGPIFPGKNAFFLGFREIFFDFFLSSSPKNARTPVRTCNRPG